MGSDWTCALELRPDRSVARGSGSALCDAVRRGADLRVYTEWAFEEHVAPDLAQPNPADAGLVREVIDMRETILVEDRYAAGVTTLRQSILPILGFNPNGPNRMSFFMYGMDGQQAVASVSLDIDARATADPGATRTETRPARMPKMSATEWNDDGTNAPSRNFVYDFEVYRFFVRDDWRPVLSHDEQGRVSDGSWDALATAHRDGREIKVGIRGLCADLAPPGSSHDAAGDHEVFTHLGTGWVHEGRRRYEALTHPLVRVAPSIPMKYRSRAWDVSWVYLRIDGTATVRSLDPYSRRFGDSEARFGCRWFTR